MSDSLPMTLEEKKELAFNIQRLAKEHIKGVRSIAFDNNSEQNEFDLEQLSQKKLRELQKYIRNKINEMENNLRSNITEKTEQQNLDELESEITEEFLDEPLEWYMILTKIINHASRISSASGTWFRATGLTTIAELEFAPGLFGWCTIEVF